MGQVALRQVAHLEVSVSAELRRRRILREEEKTKKHKERSDSSTIKKRPQVRFVCFPMSSSNVPATATASF